MRPDNLSVITFVLAGGEGRRLYPLTRYRPKPLVPFGACYRVIDFTLSNCLNSGLSRVYVLTQHDSESISTYLRKAWSRSGPADTAFALPCSPTSGKRYVGTADAVMQNVGLLEESPADLVLVLSADHIYKMDYNNLLRSHVTSGADVTIATVEHPIQFSCDVGVLEVDHADRVVGFEEKPQTPKRRDRKTETVAASMGVYVFNREILLAMSALDIRIHDIALDLIPRLLATWRVHAYRHENYWRDIGTLESYFDANMDLLSPTRNIEPDNPYWRVHTPDRLRGSSESPLMEISRDPKVNSVIARGARIGDSAVYCSVISPGVVLEDAVDIRHSVLLPGAIIGRGASVRHAVIDANVVIPAGEKIGYDLEKDRQRFTVQQNGIVIVSQDDVSASLSYKPDLHAIGGRK